MLLRALCLLYFGLLHLACPGGQDGCSLFEDNLGAFLISFLLYDNSYYRLCLI